MNIRDITQRIKWKEGTPESPKGASDATKIRTIKRIQTMANAIEAQFPEVRYCNQIKLKHMKFLRDAWFDNQGLATTTMADYTRALRLMIKALDKDQHWLGPLGLVRDRTRGGRRVVSRVTKTKSRNRR